MKRASSKSILDASLWSEINRRNDDIVIATYAKFGLLRMQAIVDVLLDKSGAYAQEKGHLPWVELRHLHVAQRLAAIEAQKSRRILRTHLSATDVYSNTGTYIFIGRDPRDLIWNFYQFHLMATEKWRAHFSQYGFSGERTKLTFVEYWDVWMRDNGVPLWSYFEQLQSWWMKRHQENLIMIHFLNFQSNMETELQRLRGFLNLQIENEVWGDVVEACSYETITDICKHDMAVEAPFWNGGQPNLDNISPIISRDNWRNYLNDTHEVELRNKLEKWIGNDGAKWVLYGTRESLV